MTFVLNAPLRCVALHFRITLRRARRPRCHRGRQGLRGRRRAGARVCGRLFGTTSGRRDFGYGSSKGVVSSDVNQISAAASRKKTIASVMASSPAAADGLKSIMARAARLGFEINEYPSRLSKWIRRSRAKISMLA